MTTRACFSKLASVSCLFKKIGMGVSRKLGLLQQASVKGKGQILQFALFHVQTDVRLFAAPAIRNLSASLSLFSVDRL
jgi:hypothetical protein